MTTRTKDNTEERIASRIILTGRVQGIGLRPAVARFAGSLSLTGCVENTTLGVEIHVEGPTQDVNRFERELGNQLPTATEIVSQQSFRIEPAGFAEFLVRSIQSQTPLAFIPAVDSQAPDESGGHETLTAQVPRDGVVCDRCIAEVRNPVNRRRGYSFTSCTDCGPRYSIIDRMPYDRPQTSMGLFSLCDSCRMEYESPQDRRFHSQTNACPQCGPQIWLRDDSDQVVARHADAIRAAAAAIREGHIVALRGLGGYQLLADATSPEAVLRLRQRKRRGGKPLGVMVGSLEVVEQLALLDDLERQLLSSEAGPIVVVRLRSNTRLNASVTNGLDTIGLMLPTTPLHWMLWDELQSPLVCTSGNIEGEPLAYESQAALVQLHGVADLWLEHDRPIRRPIDDSVVRVMAGRAVTIRMGRGYAPLLLDIPSEEPLMALGGHQKSSIALHNGQQAILGPHIGDLDTLAARERFLDQVDQLGDLYGLRNRQFACDQHPDYFTTRWAQSVTANALQLQHHSAHVVAGMLNHHWLDRRVLGVSFDGTGFGADGTIWGGEFLLGTAAGFQRVGKLRPFPLPGGQGAMREPWRVATALVHEAIGDVAAVQLSFHSGDATSLLPILARRQFSPLTTSAGRLFDGLAALILGIEQCEFEGQSAMLLEAVCDRSCSLPEPMNCRFRAANSNYNIPIDHNKQTKHLDWRPLVRRVLSDRAAGVSPSVMAMRFHRALADAIFDFCRGYSSLPVVLGGGVFQNRVLVELLAERFAESSQPLGLPGMIPPNDGGLAAGQLGISAALANRGVG